MLTYTCTCIVSSYNYSPGCTKQNYWKILHLYSQTWAIIFYAINSYVFMIQYGSVSKKYQVFQKIYLITISNVLHFIAAIPSTSGSANWVWSTRPNAPSCCNPNRSPANQIPNQAAPKRPWWRKGRHFCGRGPIARTPSGPFREGRIQYQQFLLNFVGE